MRDNKKIFWICSYPKSGNTWVRLILSGLFFTNDGKINNFDLLNKIPKFDVESNFEFIKKLSKYDYAKIFNKTKYDEESLLAYSKYWIEAQKRKKIIDGSFSFFKTHNARVKINSNIYTNSESSLGFIYISRDPRDVVVSYSDHIKKDINFTLDFLLNGQIMGKEKEKKIMPEILLNWGDNYSSWKKFNSVPNLFIRYENLLNQTDLEIEKICDFFYKNYNIKIANKNKKIENIVNTTKFENLKLNEQKYGFKENPKSQIFFRVGKHKQWEKKLNKKEIKNIETKFSNIMKELNYI